MVGTVLGTAGGAAVGGGRGAGTGAATGLFVGSMIGVNEANASSYGTQQRYDNAYIQCMYYAKGHRVPVSGHIEQQPIYNSPPPKPARYPPPPPGYVQEIPAGAPK